jgi:hypothetical protein
MTSTTDRYVAHALKLIRVGNGLNRSVSRSINELMAEVRALVARENVATMNRRALDALIREIEKRVTATYTQIASRQASRAARLVELEAAWAKESGRYVNAASARGIARATRELNVMGSSVKEQWRLQATQFATKIAANIRTARDAGEDGTGALKRIADLGIRDQTLKNAKSLVGATVQSAGDVGRRETMRANGVNAQRWMATLDARMCVECAVRHGKLWDMDGTPLGHDIPFATPTLHPNCHCIMLPMKFKDGPPKDGGNTPEVFDKWLSRQPVEKQDKILGQGRAELFRRNVITANDLINQNGRVLRLRDLSEDVKRLRNRAAAAPARTKPERRRVPRNRGGRP